MSTPWKCPHCGKKLKPKWDGGLYCLKNHQFDAAKEGYFHLLPVQNRKTKSPGDSKEMLAARRAFLNAGYYQIFGDALGALCLQYGEAQAGKLGKSGKKGAAALQSQNSVAPIASAPSVSVTNAQDSVAPVATAKSADIVSAPSVTAPSTLPLQLLDAGCGEGWYNRAISAAFAAENTPLCLAGFDIAKDAVRLAAKALPSADYAVGSSFAQPVQDGWADVLINIFSPLALEEFARVLRPNGIFIYAVPAARHLFGMKELLYDAPYENAAQTPDYEGFSLLERRTISGEITVPQEMLANLFAMTPYYWKTPRDGAARLAACERLNTEIAFDFLVFRKDA